MKMSAISADRQFWNGRTQAREFPLAREIADIAVSDSAMTVIRAFFPRSGESG